MSSARASLFEAQAYQLSLSEDIPTNYMSKLCGKDSTGYHNIYIHSKFKKMRINILLHYALIDTHQKGRITKSDLVKRKTEFCLLSDILYHKPVDSLFPPFRI